MDDYASIDNMLVCEEHRHYFGEVIDGANEDAPLCDVPECQNKATLIVDGEE